jgi:hypothetical protein
LALKIDWASKADAASLHRVVAFLPQCLAALAKLVQHPIPPTTPQGFPLGNQQLPTLLVEKPYAEATPTNVHGHDVVHDALNTCVRMDPEPAGRLLLV